MLKPRHKAREIALQVLYRFDVNPEASVPQNGSSESSSQTPLNRPSTVTLLKMGQELRQHFDHFAIPEDTRSFSSKLVAGTLENKQSIDEMIEKSAQNWKMARMSVIDRNLLRLAAFELMFEVETPTNVVLNEAIELAKQFSTAESGPFINGLLDEISKKVRS